MAVNHSGGNYFRDRMAADELQRQEQARRQQEKDHSKGWWKRGIGQGILGALPGIVTLNPVMAGAGAAGGFAGEAVNHYAFKDKQPGIAGNAASLAALGSGAAAKGLFSGAAGKAGLGGLQESAAAMGKPAAYQAELARAGNFAPGTGGDLAGPAMGSMKFSDLPQAGKAAPAASPVPDAIKFSPREVPAMGQEITDFSGNMGTGGFESVGGASLDGQLTPEEWEEMQRLGLLSGSGGR